MGIFGNEVCLQDAAKDLGRMDGITVKIANRRRLEIRLLQEQKRQIVEDTIVKNHGFVELDPFPKSDKSKKH
ncbi:MAG: hypothetical protein IH932_02410 [Thaumarchaeota archaeon]|nr:hypothetical protein [Nitrososphaerota archaeon]